ncbi:hypothetical protein FAVG1_13005 [Fusarium avenaceum]|nr:hypothetical protein FAVG1_13005 [Fusarium avenaceum]
MGPSCTCRVSGDYVNCLLAEQALLVHAVSLGCAIDIRTLNAHVQLNTAIAQVNAPPALGYLSHSKANEETYVFDDSTGEGQARRKYYRECGNRRQINDEALGTNINWPDNIQDSIDLPNNALLATFILCVLAMGYLHHKGFHCWGNM